MWGNVIAAFEAAHPGTKIEYEPVAWTEYWTKLNTQFASRSAPDIIGFQMQSRTWGVEGRFEPLSEPFADLLDGIVDFTIESHTSAYCRWNGAIRSALPNGWSVVVRQYFINEGGWN